MWGSMSKCSFTHNLALPACFSWRYHRTWHSWVKGEKKNHYLFHQRCSEVRECMRGREKRCQYRWCCCLTCANSCVSLTHRYPDLSTNASTAGEPWSGLGVEGLTSQLARGSQGAWGFVGYRVWAAAQNTLWWVWRILVWADWKQIL